MIAESSAKVPRGSFAARRALLLACWGLLAVGQIAEPIRAHEHTMPTYVGALGLQDDAPDRRRDSVDSDDASHCHLKLQLIDANTKELLSGLVRISTSDGGVLTLDGLFNRGTGLRRGHAAKEWSVLIESATVVVPRKRLTIEAFSGLETELTRETIDLAGQAAAEVTLRLVRFHDAAANGWRNGNTHLHLMSLTREQADRYLQSISRADGLELVFVSYLRRVKAERNYISNTYGKKDLDALSGHGVTFSFGEEHRHNFGPGGEGYGHVMFLNIRELIRPVSVGPGIMGEGTDWPPMRHGIDKAHEQGATTIWCHNAFGLEEVPDWIAGALDAHNIFDGGNLGGYEDTFYRFMDVGLRVPFSTGTDWFLFDFSRAYVEVDEPLTVPRWLDALEKGRSFITNGPFLEFRVDGHRPGDVIQLTQPRELEISARAVGRGDFEKIEVVHNGRVFSSQASRPEGKHFEAQTTFPLRIGEPGWIALRISSETKNAFGEPLFGHTSAVYVEVAGKTLFKPEAAEALVADMRAAIDSIRRDAKFADDDQRESVLNVYREGIDKLQARLDGR